MATGPITLHLIRHGEVHNPREILYGRLPRFRLSERGREQAGAAGQYLCGAPLDAVFSSPLLRARQTAGEILMRCGQRKLRISKRINEVRSCYEGRPGAEVDALDGDIYTGAEACFEQPADVVRRTRKFISGVRHHYSGGQVAAVTHGDVITFMVLWARGYDLIPQNKTRLLQAGYPESYPAHASITTLTYFAQSAEERPQVGYHRPS